MTIYIFLIKNIKDCIKDISKQLCSDCERGRTSYLLDPKSPVCPYLHCHTGKNCSRYEQIERSFIWNRK